MFCNGILNTCVAEHRSLESKGVHAGTGAVLGSSMALLRLPMPTESVLKETRSGDGVIGAKKLNRTSSCLLKRRIKIVDCYASWRIPIWTQSGTS